ncbi:hypothetical protein E8E13_004826 [Curvularia kusanoi]|uniref:Uncharacterized protein n=1 Tax=Curvularia kusanoi TaxID=90978 RepID=A0A9P4W501_CURKU|nr:hypothetical protein E8E13_004826 [Curvularia kusanoi]
MARSRHSSSIVFAAVYLGIVIGLCVTRRKFGRGKQLVGLPYIFALFFTFVTQIVAFVYSTLSACDADNLDFAGQYDMNTAQLIISDAGLYLLLVVAFWTLNMMLRKQLGHTPPALKVALGIDLVVLAVILLPVIVLSSYGYYFIGRESYRSYQDNLTYILLAATYMRLAFNGVIIISAFVSGALSLSAGNSLRKKHMANTVSSEFDFSMISTDILYLISIIRVSQTLTNFASFDYASNTAVYWISSLFAALAFIAVIFIAKNPVWDSKSPPAEQHSYSAVEQPYSYDYQQPPTAYGGAGQHNTESKTVSGTDAFNNTFDTLEDSVRKQ